MGYDKCMLGIPCARSSLYIYLANIAKFRSLHDCVAQIQQEASTLATSEELRNLRNSSKKNVHFPCLRM